MPGKFARVPLNPQITHKECTFKEYLRLQKARTKWQRQDGAQSSWASKSMLSSLPQATPLTTGELQLRWGSMPPEVLGFNAAWLQKLMWLMPEAHWECAQGFRSALRECICVPSIQQPGSSNGQRRRRLGGCLLCTGTQEIEASNIFTVIYIQRGRVWKPFHYIMLQVTQWP